MKTNKPRLSRFYLAITLTALPIALSQHLYAGTTTTSTPSTRVVSSSERSTTSAGSAMWITAYYTTWGACELLPQKIDFSSVTHIVHQSIDPSNSAAYAGRWWKFPRAFKDDDTLYFERGVGTGCASFPLQRILIDSAHAHGVKVLLGLGANESDYAAIASDPTKLRQYVTSVLSYARSRGYDGVDVDWEFVRSNTRTGFINLINTLKNTLETWSPVGLLTVAVPGWYNPANDVATLNARVDQINLMMYDMTGYWASTTGFNAPLYAPQISGYSGGNANTWVNGWLGNGLNPVKTGFGVPFYGLRWEGADGPTQGYTRESQVSYNWILSKYSQSSYRWQNDGQVPYLSIPWDSRDQKKYFITYDDSSSLTKKVQYAKSRGLGGMMIFELWRGLVNGQQPLMSALRRATWGTTPPPPVALATPLQIFPPKDTINISLSVNLEWSSVVGATNYQAQVSRSSDFSTTIVNDSTLTAPTRLLGPLLPSTIYYWHVRAKSPTQSSSFSPTSSFKTAGILSQVMVTPATLNFGLVPLNRTRTDSLLLTNNGAGDLHLSISASSPVFSTNPAATILSHGSTQKVYVTFAPLQRTTYVGQLIVSYTESTAKDTVAVSGVGASAPRARRNKSVINFGAIPLGISKSDSFVVYNDGDLPLTISNILSSNNIYGITPAEGTVEAADSQIFYITAVPDSVKPEKGFITQEDNSTPSLDTLLVHSETIVVTGVGSDREGIPGEFALHQNFPNPFNPTTKISFDLPAASIVTLTVYNMLGQEVARLLDGVPQEAGFHSVVWNTEGQDGLHLASGLYVYRLAAGVTNSDKEFVQVRKMMLLK